MADVRTKPEYFIDNRCSDIALTWAIYSLTEPTEYTEKNQKNTVISAGSARERVNVYN